MSEWKDQTTKIFDKICEETLKIDRMGWLSKAKPSKITVFDVIDANGDK